MHSPQWTVASAATGGKLKRWAVTHRPQIAHASFTLQLSAEQLLVFRQVLVARGDGSIVLSALYLVSVNAKHDAVFDGRANIRAGFAFKQQQRTTSFSIQNERPMLPDRSRQRSVCMRHMAHLCYQVRRKTLKIGDFPPGVPLRSTRWREAKTRTGPPWLIGRAVGYGKKENMSVVPGYLYAGSEATRRRLWISHSYQSSPTQAISTEYCHWRPSLCASRSFASWLTIC